MCVADAKVSLRGSPRRPGVESDARERNEELPEHFQVGGDTVGMPGTVEEVDLHDRAELDIRRRLLSETFSDERLSLVEKPDASI